MPTIIGNENEKIIFTFPKKGSKEETSQKRHKNDKART